MKKLSLTLSILLILFAGGAWSEESIYLFNDTQFKVDSNSIKLIEITNDKDFQLETISKGENKFLYITQKKAKLIPPLVQKKRIDKIQTKQFFDNAESQLLYSDISVSESYVQRKLPLILLLADFGELTLLKYEYTLEEGMVTDVIKNWDVANRTPSSWMNIRPEPGYVSTHIVLDAFETLGKPKEWSDETRYFAEDDLYKWMQGEGGVFNLSSLDLLIEKGTSSKYSNKKELIRKVKEQQRLLKEVGSTDNVETDIPNTGKQNLTPSLEDSVLIIEDIERNSGTAFYIRKDLIITNQHVVEGSDKMTLTTNSGKRFMAEVIAQDERTDLALLQTTDLGEPLELEPQCKVSQGDSVITMGHPIGLEYSMTKGIISSSRTIKNPFKRNVGYVTYLQIDAALSPGNSGGPLINEAGFVVGVNTWGMTETGGINFSVHCSEVKKFLLDSNINNIKEPNEPVGTRNSVVKEDSNWELVYSPLPRYPRRARALKTEGCVMLETIVTREGSVKDPRVLWTIPPDDSTFHSSALRAAYKFKFKPTGNYYKEERVKALISFIIYDPDKAEGYVIPGCEWEGKNSFGVIGDPEINY